MQAEFLPEVVHRGSCDISQQLISAAEFFAMGEDATLGLELINGEIVGEGMPTGHTHGRLEAIIAAILIMFAKRNRLGKVISGEVGIFLRRNPDFVRAPDVLFISHERFSRVKSTSFLDIAPELVIEIMSPDDRWGDVKQKVRDYFAAGVVLAWIVDPPTRSITAYYANNEVREYNEQDMITAEGILPGFNVRVAEFFED